MRWAHVEWEAKRLVLPPSILKGRKQLVLQLPDVAAEPLTAIHVDDGLVFGLPFSPRVFPHRFP